MQTKQKDTTLSNLFFSLPQIRTARPQPAYETHGRVEQDLQAESTSFAYQKNQTHTQKKTKLVKKNWHKHFPETLQSKAMGS